MRLKYIVQAVVGHVLTRIIVPRMQFYAIEIARNRQGLNDWVFEKNQKDSAEKK